MSDAILTINGGSSSIKFALFSRTVPAERLLAGSIERIGTSGATLHAQLQNAPPITEPVPAEDHAAAAQHLTHWLAAHAAPAKIIGIGHRIVHGGLHLFTHQIITPQVLDQLRQAEPLDATHLPREIALIKAFAAAFPAVTQVACLDTAFHHDMPHVAQLLPIPRNYLDNGVRRFGFHGLSYTYLMSEIMRIDPAAASGRVILAHLGSGASMAAVNAGKPIDTTMAFTPTAGLVMATRPGDLDPGLLIYLMRTEKLTADQLDELISQRCGMRGVSATSGDLRDLSQRRQNGDTRAADAIDLFCYQARKMIGALMTTLGGLDTLVFSGGIGEHAAEARAQICDGLAFLGITLNPARNIANAPVISENGAKMTIRVIPTDEESVIAEVVVKLLPQT